MPQISIIILAFNKFNFTNSCLNDLFKLDSAKCEIILVDNGSTDQTQEQMNKLAQQHSNLIYIRNEINKGFAAGCNKGYSCVSSDIVLFLNNDIRVKTNDDWTDTLMDFLQKHPNTLCSPHGGFVDPKNSFKFCYETKDPGKQINYISGWCLAGKKETFNKLIMKDYQGPFSEEFFCYFEDTDLSFRGTQQGIDLCLLDLPLIHFGKISSSQLNTNILYTKSKVIFNNKWNKKDRR